MRRHKDKCDRCGGDMRPFNVCRNCSNVVRVGVACFVFNERDEWLVMKRKGSHGAGTWGLPGGHIEFGEKIEDCAAREILEETGLLIPASYIVPGGTSQAVFAEERKHYITVICYVNFVVSVEPKIMEPEKCSELRWVKRSTLPEPVFAPLANYLKSDPSVLL